MKGIWYEFSLLYFSFPEPFLYSLLSFLISYFILLNFLFLICYFFSTYFLFSLILIFLTLAIYHFITTWYQSGTIPVTVTSPENTKITVRDEHFGGFGAEFSPLEICKKAVQENVIHSFKPTSTKEIYEKWGKGVCEFCDEQLKEI